jgi:hypothetical protein
MESCKKTANYYKYTVSSEQRPLNCAPTGEGTSGKSSPGEGLKLKNIACLMQLIYFPLTVSKFAFTATCYNSSDF